MINKLLKGLVDFIYGVERVKDNYLKENPTERILAADSSKGITTKEDQEIEKGVNWLTSQRAVILLTDERIKSGRWDIPLETIETAQLLKINALLGQGQVLKLKTKNNIHYQFGMQFNPEWTSQTVLPLTLEKGKIKLSAFSVIVRLVLVAYIVYWLLKTFELV